MSILVKIKADPKKGKISESREGKLDRKSSRKDHGRQQPTKKPVWMEAIIEKDKENK